MGHRLSIIRVDYTPNEQGLLKVWVTNQQVKRANSTLKYYSPEQDKFFSETQGRYHEWLYAPKQLHEDMQQRLTEHP